MASIKELVQRVRGGAAPLPPDLKDKDEVSLSMPEGIDFSQLWLEPTDQSSLGMILSGISVAVSIIIMLIVIFKH